MTDDMLGQLQTYYASALSSLENVQVKELTAISTGWESDVYSFTAEHGQPDNLQSQELILRIYPGDDASEKSSKEFRGMTKLFEAGYPVP